MRAAVFHGPGEGRGEFGANIAVAVTLVAGTEQLHDPFARSGKSLEMRDRVIRDLVKRRRAAQRNQFLVRPVDAKHRNPL